MGDKLEAVVQSPLAESGAELFKKVLAVMAAVARIPKRGKNVHFGYEYATEADVADAVRTELVKQGLLIIPRTDKLEWSRDEKGNVLAFLTVEFEVTDGTTSFRFKVVGSGIDKPGDKAVYKAFTGAEKYALMKLLLIPTGDDPERDEKAPAEEPKQAQKEEPRKALKERKLQALAVITQFIQKTKAKATLREFVADALGREVDEAITLKNEAEVLALEEQAELLTKAKEK